MKTWYFLVFYAFLIIASGAGTYLKILPETTFLTVLSLIIGYHTGLVTPPPAQPPSTPPEIGASPGTYVGVHPAPAAKDIRSALAEQSTTNATTSTPT